MIVTETRGDQIRAIVESVVVDIHNAFGNADLLQGLAAAERARRNDSVAGRVKNTAISTATRQIVSNLTKNLTKAISGLFGGKK